MEFEMAYPEKPKNHIDNMEVETHFFTTMRYKNPVDSGFSGNLALLLEAIKTSDKVTDNNIKILAESIFNSVVKHDVKKHDKHLILQKYKEKEENEKKSNVSEIVE